MRLFVSLLILSGVLAGSLPARAATVRVIDPTVPSYCAPYQQTTTFGKNNYTGHGIACSQSGGSWELTPDPSDAVTYEGRGLRAHFIFKQAPPNPDQGNCQEFQQTTLLGYTMQKSKGVACYQQDGSWQILTVDAQILRYKALRDLVYMDPFRQPFQLAPPHPHIPHPPAR
ncbi:MAG TPA: hypothetical protein VGF14_02460 [Alphaproteobacteria bacterium]